MRVRHRNNLLLAKPQRVCLIKSVHEKEPAEIQTEMGWRGKEGDEDMVIEQLD